MPGEYSRESPHQSLRRDGLRPRKSLGQNFLRDRSFLKHIVDALELTGGDRVVEIGAGTGVLTETLLDRAGSVMAIELDDRLYDMLARRFELNPALHLWHGNALDFDPCRDVGGEYKLAGNIPYYITGPIVRHFLESQCRPAILVLMVQREVAERMVARPGDLSLLGLSVQYYADARVVTRVPPGAFFPRPKVESAIVRLVPHTSQPAPEDADAFFTVARAGFSTRRKQLANSLTNGLQVERDEARTLLSDAGVEETKRAEVLTLDDWKRLASVWARSQARQDSRQ